MSHNYVRIQGNLGSKPEIKETKEGNEYAVMNVAVSERFYDTDKSQWVNTETQWFRAVAWNALEISEAKQLDKGSIVSVEGRININDYEDKEGNKRQSYEVTVSDISEIVRREKKAA